MAGARLKHGHCTRGARSSTRSSWNSMIRRCKYPSMEDYGRYGGKGIRVCERWESFQNFLDDMGNRPRGKTLDRIDNDGHYEPHNCRWATLSQQVRNSRKARYITHGGRTMTIGDWSVSLGINRQTIQMRLDRYGWSAEKALTTEVYHR